MKEKVILRGKGRGRISKVTKVKEKEWKSSIFVMDLVQSSIIHSIHDDVYIGKMNLCVNINSDHNLHGLKEHQQSNYSFYEMLHFSFFQNAHSMNITLTDEMRNHHQN